MDPVSNLWLRGSLVNPYYRTAFRVARVPREVVRHRTLVQLVSQTRQLVETDPKAHSIGGLPVTSSEVNTAQQTLMDPQARILEELLEHATEKLPLEAIRKLAQEVAQAMDAEGALSNPDIKPLELLAPTLIREFLTAVPGTGPSFGAVELETPPPFGQEEE